MFEEIASGSAGCREESGRAKNSWVSNAAAQSSAYQSKTMSRAMLAACALFLAAACGAMAQTTAGNLTPLPGAATSFLPANRWVKLQTVPTERFTPEAYVDCTPTAVLSNPVGRRASGTVYGDGSILYFGGGGGSHPGNDVELYDIASNTWTQTYPPECLPACCATDTKCDPACGIEAGVGTTALTPLGRPYTEHAYRRIAYDPGRHEFLAALTSGTWTWDPATTNWSLLTPTIPFSDGIETKTVAYDPDLQTELFFATTKTHRVFAFDWDTNTWVDHGAIPSPIEWAEIYTAYDPVQHKHLVSHLGNGGTMWVYDAVGMTWTPLTDVPSQVLRASDMDYDADNGVFLLATVQQDVPELWTYEIETDTWTQIQAQGTPPTSPLHARFGTLTYDPLSHRFFYLNVKEIGSGGDGGLREGDVETWMFRLGSPNETLCVGDCNGDSVVTANELMQAVNIVLDPGLEESCFAADSDGSGFIDVTNVVLAVRNALNGCGS